MSSACSSGPAGRNGNTIGTLICEDFQCSRIVRTPVPPAYDGYDVDAVMGWRIDDLRLIAATFAEKV